MLFGLKRRSRRPYWIAVLCLSTLAIGFFALRPGHAALAPPPQTAHVVSQIELVGSVPSPRR